MPQTANLQPAYDGEITHTLEQENQARISRRNRCPGTSRDSIPGYRPLSGCAPQKHLHAQLNYRGGLVLTDHNRRTIACRVIVGENGAAFSSDEAQLAGLSVVFLGIGSVLLFGRRWLTVDPGLQAAPFQTDRVS
jgi:hypothetical protein